VVKVAEEERKARIEAKMVRLLGNFPDMPEGMAKKIAEWNVDQDIAHGHDWIKSSMISNVNHLAYMWRFDYEKLASEDLEEAFSLLTKILGTTLASRVGKDDELKRYFCIYVHNQITLNDNQ
jgi:hypothetical protein